MEKNKFWAVFIITLVVGMVCGIAYTNYNSNITGAALKSSEVQQKQTLFQKVFGKQTASTAQTSIPHTNGGGGGGNFTIVGRNLLHAYPEWNAKMDRFGCIIEHGHSAINTEFFMQIWSLFYKAMEKNNPELCSFEVSEISTFDFGNLFINNCTDIVYNTEETLIERFNLIDSEYDEDDKVGYFEFYEYWFCGGGPGICENCP